MGRVIVKRFKTAGGQEITFPRLLLDSPSRLNLTVCPWPDTLVARASASSPALKWRLENKASPTRIRGAIVLVRPYGALTFFLLVPNVSHAGLAGTKS